MPVSGSRLDVLPQSTSCSNHRQNKSSSCVLALPYGVNESAVSGDALETCFNSELLV